MEFLVLVAELVGYIVIIQNLLKCNIVNIQ